MKPDQKSNLLALCLLALGSTTMLGHILKIPALKGIGLATSAAPYTKVFCQATALDDGRPFETFAADFELHYQLPDGTEQITPITPELYQKIQGPYQRRNVYGAVLAYGPALPEEMRKATLQFALQNPGTVPRELGLPKAASHYQVKIISRTQNSDNQWIITP